MLFLIADSTPSAGNDITARAHKQAQEEEKVSPWQRDKEFFCLFFLTPTINGLNGPDKLKLSVLFSHVYLLFWR